MFKLTSTLVVLGVVALALAAGPQGKDADREAIKQTALDYGQGWYEGSAERMARALHPELAKRALMPDGSTGKGKLDQMDKKALVDATREGSGKHTPEKMRRTEVTILEVYGNAATVKLMMHDWVDYMHMVKTQGRWKIVNVLWEMTPEAKKKFGIPEEL